MALYLGIDIGTSGSRALLIDERGAVKASAGGGHTCQAPKPLWSEQDPAEWWAAVRKAVPEALKKAGARPAEIKGIGLSGQMHGLTLLDAKDQVLRPAILWNDQRTAEECAEIVSRAGGLPELLRMVSNPALTGFTAPKILWVRRHEPQLYERARKALLPKDYIRLLLTGEYATEVSDASGTLLLDIRKRAWSNELLGKLELDAGLLPKVYESPEVSGKVTEAASQALGGAVLPGTPVVGGGGDQAAGGVGAGIVQSGIASVSLGTSGVVFLHADTLKTDPRGRLHAFCHAVPGKWHMMGVCLASGGSFQWFRNALGQPEVEAAKMSGADPYDLLVAQAAAEPAGSRGVCFLPYLTGERTPHADPYATGTFVGITPSTTKGALARAIVEGVCYSLRDSFEIFKALGLPVGEVRVTGGGAKNPFWRQTLADVFGQGTRGLAAAEGPAYGVALLAAVGAGAFKSVEEACRATVQTCDPLEPKPPHVKVYNAFHPLWQNLYRSLKGDYEKLSKAVHA
ncbi:MAG: xylulokinase [Planctomycetota bacterium]|nr:xylulokinase [Planctomycetota bacterium]